MEQLIDAMTREQLQDFVRKFAPLATLQRRLLEDSKENNKLLRAEIANLRDLLHDSRRNRTAHNASEANNPSHPLAAR